MKRFTPFLVLFLMVGCMPLSAANGALVSNAPWGTKSELNLLERKVTLSVENGLAYMEVEDRFRNHLDFQLEGLYRFQLPPHGFAAGLAINTDEQNWVKGKIMDIAQARLAYHEITRRMTDPGLLEQHDGELSIRVFPIEAKKTVGIRFRCFFPVKPGTAGLTVTIPVATRLPAGPGADRFGREDQGPPPLPRFSLQAVVRDSRGLKNVRAEPSGSAVSEKDGQFIVHVATDQGLPESVRILGEFAQPAGLLDAARYRVSSDNDFLLLRLSEFAGEPLPSPLNLAVIVDGSGSMGGRNQLRSRAVVDQLSKDPRFTTHLYVAQKGGLTACSLEGFAGLRAYGPSPWQGCRNAETPAGEAVLLLTDGEGLDAGVLKALFHVWKEKPLWVVHLGSDPTEENLAVWGAFGGSVSLRFQLEAQEVERILAKPLELLAQQYVLKLGGDPVGPPLFGKIGKDALFVLPWQGKSPAEVTNRLGKVVQTASIDAHLPAISVPAWFQHFPVRQQIHTLSCREQTEQVRAAITRLGMQYGQATDYTAFLAVPEEVAREHADVLNPKYLAMFAAPNFRKARDQARDKACFANQRVTLGALEMYFMDHDFSDLGRILKNKETGEVDLQVLADGEYLKKTISKPTPGCEYRLLWLGNGNMHVLCLKHGFVDQQPGNSLEEEISERCEEAGVDPLDYDIPVDSYQQESPDEKPWLFFHELLPLARFLACFLP